MRTHKRTIDLNCDLGEGFGVYPSFQDEAMMALITSANIACGMHAGDPVIMEKTVHLAVSHGVGVGAHPGYPDLLGFGRREMALAAEDIYACVLYQIGALNAFTRQHGVPLAHVKLHGSLYNRAARDLAAAQAVIKAMKDFDSGLILVGLAGSHLIRLAREAGLRAAAEGFPDRAYEPDGSLQPRSQPGAVLHHPQEIARNALKLAREGISITREGKTDYIPVDTLCLHGDHPDAVENARAVRSMLEDEGILIRRMEG